MLGLVFGSAALVYLISLASGAITNPVWRVLVALVLGALVARFLVGYFRQATQSLPDDPEPEEVPRQVHLIYICEMCGLELAVAKLAKDKAPKHCGEEMKLFVEEA